MIKLEEQASYLQSLKEAAGLDLNDPKQKLLSELTDTVSMLCHMMYTVSEVNDGLNESVAALEEQMAMLFEEEPQPDDGMGTDDYFEEGETMLYQVKCPECGDQFAVDEASLLKGFNCPNCGQHLVQA